MSRPRMKFYAQDLKDKVGLNRLEAKLALRNRFPDSSNGDIEGVLNEVYV